MIRPSSIARHQHLHGPVWLYWDIGALPISGGREAQRRLERRYAREFGVCVLPRVELVT